MIRFETLTMPAASLGRENPMPDIGNVGYIHAGYRASERLTKEEKQYIGAGMISTMIPYRLQDGYDRDKKLRAFRTAVLENSRLRAVFLPELGGRLWSLYDKTLGRELLYVNPVFQPGNLALRNAWFSGGVEFNVGIKGHNPLSCSPMWCAADRTVDGEVLRLYEFERIRGVAYSVSAWLPEDSSVLYLRCRIENRTDEEKHMYWWSNIAVPETPATRVLVPAGEAFLCFYNVDHYTIDKTPIPCLPDGSDVSYAARISSSRDFFYKIPKERPKWIAAAGADGRGLLQCSTSRLFGRKLFVWGQGQGGRHWNEWLSGKDSAYVEIQAGLAHTQMEHIPMPAGETWEWTEAYTALDCEAGAMHGDYAAACRTAEEYMLSRVGDPDQLPFPSDEAVTDSRIVYCGSDWGSLEEAVRGTRISETLAFPRGDDPETAEWRQLLDTGSFPVPPVGREPISYVTGAFWQKRLEALAEPSWYSLLHLGVIRYAAGDADGAVQAWEDSLACGRSPWALRNLAMIYKNVRGDLVNARKYLLEAFRMKPDCTALCVETAQLLTSDGGDALWLTLYESLSPEMRRTGRLRYHTAAALLHLGRLREAAGILNRDFIMSDLKEGELSASTLWFALYRRLYAEENGIQYREDDAELAAAADQKYPLPRELDFRMHD